MKIEVVTREYENEYGKKPRGYGSWAFFPGTSRDAESAIWAHGTFTDAVRQVKEKAKRLGCSHITVGY